MKRSNGEERANRISWGVLPLDGAGQPARGDFSGGSDDRRYFLQCLAEACGEPGWRVHAWVLMGNHYHLFAGTPEANCWN